MKLKKVLLLLLICFFANISFVCADCSDEELSKLKEIANNVNIVYEYQGEAAGAFGYEDGTFDVIITNIVDDIYIRDEFYNYVFNTSNADSDGKIVLKSYVSGNHVFKIYAQNCDKLLRVIELNIPRYNPYSEDPLCEGISGDDLDVCNKWYKYDLEYDDFKKAVEEYKKDSNKNGIADEENIFNNIFDFFSKNILYILISVVIIGSIVVIVIVKRKRSVLN